MKLDLAEAFCTACIAELQAIKPGNVHIFADGHGMVVQDFIKSAEAVASVIAQPNLTVGERILHSAEATQQSVNCNTNLGIILLCAVIIQANITVDTIENNLKGRIQHVLNHLTVQDAKLAFQAITLANPAGLGASEHDVRAPAQITLLQAMQAAQDRDLIAQQYSNGFADIFNIGLMSYQAALDLWQNPTWATTFVYLSFLAEFPDSHIMRKFGVPIAGQVQHEAAQHLEAFAKLENPKTYLRSLMLWDTELKLRSINPGTSADLTVATLLACACKPICNANRA